MAAFKVPLLVTAQDRDQPGTENAAVRYTIVDGDPGGNFRYQRNATGGNKDFLITKLPIDYELL